MRASTLMNALAAAGAAAAIGLACGHAVAPRDAPLARAGSPRDDGIGVLAHASGAAATGAVFGKDPDAGGAGFGGARYGGARYGGTRYGGYRFERNDGPDVGVRTSYAVNYSGTDAGPRGAIVGQILWPHGPRASATLGGARGCAERVANPTARVDARGRVAEAVVYLEDVHLGRTGMAYADTGESSLQLGGSLRARDCQFFPRVQIMARGGHLELISESQESGRMRVHKGLRQVFDVPVVRGAAQRIRIDEFGTFEIRDERVPTSAWVISTPHPYYTVSLDDGSFRLDRIVPGHYTLVVWYPPVATESESGALVTGAPTVYKTRVEVAADKDKRVTIKLPRPDKD